MIYTDGFLDDAARMWSGRARDRLGRMLAAIEAFPEIGSIDVPLSLRAQYGGSIRKAVVDLFDLVYEFDSEADCVIVYGLAPFRAAR